MFQVDAIPDWAVWLGLVLLLVGPLGVVFAINRLIYRLSNKPHEDVRVCRKEDDRKEGDSD